MKLIAALLACTATLAHAGTIEVTVTDKEGKPVPDVVVTIESAVPGAAASMPVPARAKPIVVVQEGSQFVPATTVAQVGNTLRFVNKDSYDHHVRSTPTGPLGSVAPVKNIELRLDGARSSAQNEYSTVMPARAPSGTSTGDVKVDQPGAIGLGCHLHGSMRGHVYVSATPWFGKTDANGVASIANVPDGNAKLVLWHPDQLQEQAPVNTQATAAPVKATAQLNFSPRRRR